MKQIFVILLLFASRLYSQLAAPDLRCIEVLPGGTGVKLTWIPPPDPANLFIAYEIYHSLVGTPPFVLVGTIGSLNTTTAVITTVSSGYFYMITRCNPANASSGPSDTLRTIFLNIIATTGAVDLKLKYNEIHAPKLPSTGNQFTISKEYPIGTWNTLAVTPGLSYADTLSVCNASINYQVSIPDQSGCLSISNLQGGDYKDRKSPNKIYVDSISVLPNGQTIIAWHIPRDEDLIRYEIQYGDTHIPIDSVKGRNNKAYTYTSTTADNQEVGLFVKGIDSCGNGSGEVDYEPRTIFLTASYDRCAYKTELSWSPYTLRSKDILQYRIYYSAGGGPFTLAGVTSQTTFTHPGVTPGKDVVYFVRMITKDRRTTSSSNQKRFFSTQAQAPAYVYIKTASVYNKNTIDLKLRVDTSKRSVGIDLYRSVDSLNYTYVGFLPYSGLRDYSFSDNKVESDTYSYFYKAIVKDSCGNERTTSNVAKTILLGITSDKENLFTWHLRWNSYKGFGGGVSGYNIYRVINGEVESTPAGYTGSDVTAFTDNMEAEAPNGSRIEYLVQAVEGINNPLGIQEKSNSNRREVYMEGRIFVPNAFAPNGLNKTWRPVTHFIDNADYHVRVFNRWGHKVFDTSSHGEAWDGGNCPPGVYVYLVTYRNSRGEYIESKGTVLLLQ